MTIDDFSEIKDNWSSYKTPFSSFFPLVDMEERKQIALSVTKNVAYKNRKIYGQDLEELFSESLFFVWSDNELSRRLKLKAPATTKEEQKRLFEISMYRVIYSLARGRGCVNGVKLGGSQRVKLDDYKAEKDNNGSEE